MRVSGKAGRRRFGYVRKLPSGRWQASYLGPDGQRHIAPATFPTKTDAGRWLAIVESDVLRGVWRARPTEVLTVGEWGDRWLESVRPHLKRTTVATYEVLMRVSIRPAFGRTELSQVRPIDVAEWLATMSRRGNSPSWVRKSYRLLSQLMKAAVDNDLIQTSPMRGHRLPRLPEPDPRILTPDEVAALVAACSAPHDVIVLVLAYGGLRIGEALGLRVGDVSADGSVVTIARRVTEIAGQLDEDTPKAHQTRTVTLPPFVAGRLVQHLAERCAGVDEPLFVGKRGAGIRYRSWRQLAFDPAVAAAGLTDVTPHDLRATHATWVADSHGVLAAARRLGHSNASVTTRHYARAVDSRDGEIAASFTVPTAPKSVAR